LLYCFFGGFWMFLPSTNEYKNRMKSLPDLRKALRFIKVAP